MKVVDISNPDVRATMSEAEKKDNKESKDSKPSAFRVRRAIKDNFTRRMRNNAQEAGELENQSNLLRDSGREISADLANLRLLMAVEDLLDNASSDLVASALAEAANLDQRRAASRNVQATFLQNAAAEKKSNSAQGSRGSSSPPTSLSAVETETKVNVHQERRPLSESGPKSPLLSLSERTSRNEKTDSSLEKDSISDEPVIDNGGLYKETKVMRSEVCHYVDGKSKAHVEVISGTKHSDKCSDDRKCDDISNMKEEDIKKEDEGRSEAGSASDANLKSSITESGDPGENSMHSSSNRESGEAGKGREEAEEEDSEKREPKVKDVLKDEGTAGVDNASSQAATEEDNGCFVSEFFDARSDEFSESDKNRQNERGRALLSSDRDLLFNKTTEVKYIFLYFTMFSHVLSYFAMFYPPICCTFLLYHA